MTLTATHPLETLEFWMELKDRDLLVELMETQKVSARQLSTFAGYKSHTYLQRLIRGEVNTLKEVPAVRIAYRLGTPVHRLFATRSSGERAQSVRERDAA